MSSQVKNPVVALLFSVVALLGISVDEEWLRDRISEDVSILGRRLVPPR